MQSRNRTIVKRNGRAICTREFREYDRSLSETSDVLVRFGRNKTERKENDAVGIWALTTESWGFHHRDALIAFRDDVGRLIRERNLVVMDDRTFLFCTRSLERSRRLAFLLVSRHLYPCN